MSVCPSPSGGGGGKKRPPTIKSYKLRPLRTNTTSTPTFPLTQKILCNTGHSITSGQQWRYFKRYYSIRQEECWQEAHRPTHAFYLPSTVLAFSLTLLHNHEDICGRFLVTPRYFVAVVVVGGVEVVVVGGVVTGREV